MYPNYENNFLARECSDLVIEDEMPKNCQGKEVPMGYATPSDTRGIFALRTRKQSTESYLNDKKTVEVTVYGLNYTTQAMCNGKLQHLGVIEE